MQIVRMDLPTSCRYSESRSTDKWPSEPYHEKVSLHSKAPHPIPSIWTRSHGHVHPFGTKEGNSRRYCRTNTQILHLREGRTQSTRQSRIRQAPQDGAAYKGRSPCAIALGHQGSPPKAPHP